MAVPTIVALEAVLKRIEDLQDQCTQGHLRTDEMPAMLPDLDRRVSDLLRPRSLPDSRRDRGVAHGRISQRHR